MNKISPIIGPQISILPEIRSNININIPDLDNDFNLRKRTTNTPSPPLTPQIHIVPPPPTPIQIHLPPLPFKQNVKKSIITIENNYEKNKETHNIILKDDMDYDIIEQSITKIKNTPIINLRYDRLNVHDYIYNYILFAYNFYSPIFTMYITIITYKQMNLFSSIFKNIVICYAIIYPLIAMFILLHEAYYIYCKKFIYYKMMDNGVIFKWKKEYLYKSGYFWWYILSLIFICIGINDSWNVLLMFINQTSNLCIYIYSAMNIESTLITLNGFFENNIILQTENIKKIIWIEEDKLKENVYGMIEIKKNIQKNINNEVKLLLSSFMENNNDKDDYDDTNILIMENFEKYKKFLNTKTIIEYYKVMEKCNPDIDIIGKVNIKRHNDYVIDNRNMCGIKQKWVLTLLNEIKQNYNMFWNHKCMNCDLLKDMNYYLCLVCNSYLCESCNILNTKHSLKSCYMSKYMDHKTICVYISNNANTIENNISTYPFYYKLFYHHELDNIQIINILDTIYYLSIISIFIIEFYGFYIIFTI